MIYIVSTDNLLFDALEVILHEHGIRDIAVSDHIPDAAELIIADADTVTLPAERAGILTISADKRRGADLLRPFIEEDFVNAVRLHLPVDGGSAPRLTTQGLIYRGISVSLSPIEYKIFKLLYYNMGRCVKAEKLLEIFDGQKSESILPVYIGFLRKKLDYTFGQRLIYTVRGRGYMLKFQ